MRRLLPALALVFVGSRIRPALTFRPYQVRVNTSPEALATELRERLSSGGNVIVEQDDAMVARFSGRAARLKWHTVELVKFGPGHVEFEHMGGTFSGTRERFPFAAANGATELNHTGSLSMPGGVFGWIAGALYARRAFEQHVAAHMDAMVTRHDASISGAGPESAA